MTAIRAAGARERSRLFVLGAVEQRVAQRRDAVALDVGLPAERQVRGEREQPLQPVAPQPPLHRR